MTTGIIIIITLSALVLLSIIGVLVYFFVIKKSTPTGPPPYKATLTNATGSPLTVHISDQSSLALADGATETLTMTVDSQITYTVNDNNGSPIDYTFPTKGSLDDGGSYTWYLTLGGVQQSKSTVTFINQTDTTCNTGQSDAGMVLRPSLVWNQDEDGNAVLSQGYSPIPTRGGQLTTDYYLGGNDIINFKFDYDVPADWTGTGKAEPSSLPLEISTAMIPSDTVTVITDTNCVPEFTSESVSPAPAFDPCNAGTPVKCSTDKDCSICWKSTCERYCNSDKVCDCVGSFGDSCTTDDSCDTGKCIAGTCASSSGTVPAGNACTKDADCDQGFCLNLSGGKTGICTSYPSDVGVDSSLSTGPWCKIGDTGQAGQCPSGYTCRQTWLDGYINGGSCNGSGTTFTDSDGNQYCSTCPTGYTPKVTNYQDQGPCGTGVCWFNSAVYGECQLPPYDDGSCCGSYNDPNYDNSSQACD